MDRGAVQKLNESLVKMTRAHNTSGQPMLCQKTADDVARALQRMSMLTEWSRTENQYSNDTFNRIEEITPDDKSEGSPTGTRCIRKRSESTPYLKDRKLESEVLAPAPVPVPAPAQPAVACDGARMQAVGIVAFRGQAPNQHVCLVEREDGSLGFPKGVSLAGECSLMETALRKWREDTGLPIGGLCGLDEDSAVADAIGCQYLLADWADTRSMIDAIPAPNGNGESWQLRARQNVWDPVVRAHWMDCEAAASHSQFSRERRELLAKARKLLSCSVWLGSVPAPQEPQRTRRALSAAPQRGLDDFAVRAFGVIVLRGKPPRQATCIVEKQDGSLGFPKGSLQPGEFSHVAAAVRKWREDSNLPTNFRRRLDEGVTVKDGWGCCYFVAEWSSSEIDADDDRVWDVAATGGDPVVRAHWMSCCRALNHPQLSRQRRELLRHAQLRLERTRWLAGQPCPPENEDRDIDDADATGAFNAWDTVGVPMYALRPN